MNAAQWLANQARFGKVKYAHPEDVMNFNAGWDAAQAAHAEEVRLAQEQAWNKCIEHLEPALDKPTKRAAYADNPYTQGDKQA